ncbi:UNVERIFIED_CONTAM: hypothetical protein GTU68_029902 [Idotea baltica]|nr:hypothetical protein [Idotea baltica]
MSHACGVGDEVPSEIVRTMLALKINNLSQGYSGVRWELVERLQRLFNEEIYPVVYQLGSLGASGDLAPLAHLSLPIIGMGEVNYKGEKREAKGVLQELKIEPMTLSFKEGLALLNGTQFSLAYALHSIQHAKKILKIANLTAALSCISYVCKTDPFHPSLSRIRKHQGQIDVAKKMFQLMTDSKLSETIYSVQDPYSFRCVPQVHGASNSAINHVAEIVGNEINAVTDNPNVFDEEDMILIGGNFHAQLLALPLDYLAIALSELGSISERRSYKLINGDRGLPSYLADNAGLHSGFMICQYTAASIASQNKQLCTPASVDSIVSSKGQEDHVSMAANGATKLYRVVENTYRLMAIEWMLAAQAIEYRDDITLAPELKNLFELYRKEVPKLTVDRYLSPDILKTEQFLRKNI